MNLDEQSVVDALHDIDATIPSDLASRARAGGRRRLIRGRIYAAAGVVALAAVATPVALALTSSGKASIEPAHQHLYPGLYAPPPSPGSECNSGTAGKTPAEGYSDLLLLPPAATDASALVRAQSWNCLPAHVALTALKMRGQDVAAGLVVDGPNAPTPEEVNLSGPGVHFAGQLGQLAIRGRAAAEYTWPGADHTDVYWTEADGGQWFATVSGMPRAQAVDLLDRIDLDSHAGTATLPGAASDGWTVEPSADDPARTGHGVVFANWRDPQAHKVDLTVMQGPDRVSQFAAGAPAGPYAIAGYVGPMKVITVRGHRAAYGVGRSAVVFWQESPDVEVLMSVEGADETEIQQVAESLTLASPNDPRISKN